VAASPKEQETMSRRAPWKEELRPAWLALRRFLRPGGRLARLNGVELRLDPAVSLPPGQAIDYEREFFTAFLDAIREGDVVLDVGANQGLHTVCAGLRGARVYAFEPAPPALAILQKMVDINGTSAGTTLVAAVVGATDGETVAFHAAPTAVGWASAAYAPPGTREFLVPTVSLDSFCHRHNLLPRVVKIDVEGFEGEVLRGAKGILAKARPTVFCALHPEILEKIGASPRQVVEMMEQLGYAARGPGGKGVDLPADTEVIFLPS
jgi:FkbM family methyltransferase